MNNVTNNTQSGISLQNNRKNYLTGIVCILITTIVFSTIEFTGKMISHSIDPLQLTFFRFMTGGLFLLPFAIIELRRRRLAIKPGDILFFLFAGILGTVISMTVFQTAISYTKASVVAVIFSTNPIYTAILAVLFLKEKMTALKAVALAASIIGVTFIFNPFSANPDIKGMLLALASAVIFSVYIVYSKSRVVRYGSLVLNCFSFILGSAVLLIFMLLTGQKVISGIGQSNILHLLYLGIFTTGIGYLCYFTAMKHTSAITASMVYFIKPVLATALSWLILSESISTNTAIGIAVNIAASVMMLLPKRRSL